jgi:hypothetical protein
VSDAPTKPRTFFGLFMDGQATEDQADERVTGWHNSGDEEQRPLTEFLGMTDEEYELWTWTRAPSPSLPPRAVPATRP